jgi:hypothetical protein
MSGYTGDNQPHKSAVQVLEATRQVAVASASTQAAVNTAEVNFYKGCLTSAKANNVPYEVYVSALRNLGITSGLA